MKKSFPVFFIDCLKDFFEAAINLVIFLPYFFSVNILTKTLFSPWKNLIAKKRERGFSFEEWVNRFSFNLISRMIGFMMRLAVLFFYFLWQMIYLLALPFLLIIFVVLTPVFYLKYRYEKTIEEKKQIAKELFIKKHLLNKENLARVGDWFEVYYQDVIFHEKWWKLKNLFSRPPLARDWSVGYTPTLDLYVEELTDPQYQKKITKIVDREKELEQIVRILSKSQEANVIIVGEEGVGKHTIVDTLSKKIFDGQINPLLAYRRVLKINLERILDEKTDQKQREALLEQLFQEASEAKNVIMMIENLDKYIAHEVGRVDLTLVIEKFAKRSTLQFVATATPFFYEKFVFPNEKINRLFTKVDVREIPEEEALKILLSAVPFFEERYQISIPYETVKDIIDKSNFYITYIPFPEKAIDLLDYACGFIKKEDKNRCLTPEIVNLALSEKIHIPTDISQNMKDKLINLETLLGQRIIQQEEAVKKLSAALRRSFLLIGKRKKPLATFLFLGPTGVGKTETAKSVAEIFFGSPALLIRFDMSLYQSKNDIVNLIGSLESGNPGLLSKAVRENPYGVLLLDEIEKADKDLINIFLTVLDEGYFIDGFGKKVDCKNLVIIATSNAGSDYFFTSLSQSDNSSAKNNQDNLIIQSDTMLIEKLVNDHFFSPEFLNRFDGIIFFRPLSPLALKKIARNIISKIAENIYKIHRVKIAVSEATIDRLIAKGFDKKFGARNLERVINEEIEDQIAKIILEKKTDKQSTINL
ncbi:MAG: AAA family ATPase [Microgenomates group bacterium]|nr:AAA family ATPase [Microgenomates group bacterium]